MTIQVIPRTTTTTTQIQGSLDALSAILGTLGYQIQALELDMTASPPSCRVDIQGKGKSYVAQARGGRSTIEVSAVRFVERTSPMCRHGYWRHDLLFRRLGRADARQLLIDVLDQLLLQHAEHVERLPIRSLLGKIIQYASALEPPKLIPFVSDNI